MVVSDLIGLVIFAIFFPLFLAFLFVTIMLIIGVIWSPFTAIICGMLSYKRGLNVIFYSIIGMIYSALFFLPWLYVVRRIRSEDTFTDSEIKSLYWTLFISWTGYLIFHIYVTIMIFSDAWSPEYLKTLALTFTLLSFVAFAVSIISIYRKNTTESAESHVSDKSLIPHISYILPLVYLFIGIPVIWAIGYIALRVYLVCFFMC